jgi:hypothetical protein
MRVHRIPYYVVTVYAVLRTSLYKLFKISELRTRIFKLAVSSLLIVLGTKENIFRLFDGNSIFFREILGILVLRTYV